MLSEANFLILDEPTNHLDITSKEILESALNQYTGTVLFVSHDRYFINKTATRIMDLTEQTIVNYVGNYDYYLEKHDVQMRTIAPAAAASIKTERKNESAKQRKKAAALKRTEDEIAEKEALMQALNEEMNQPEVATNSARLSEIHGQMVELEEALEGLYEAWETLAEEE